MPGKRATRHFSQLSEFERGLIIGIKLQAGRRAVLLTRWIVQSVPLEVVGSSGHEKKRVENRVWSDQEDFEERGSKDRAASTCGPHSDSFNDTSRRRRSNCPKSKHPFRALPLTPEHRQLRLQWCQARSMWNVTDWQKVVFSDESWFVLGTDDNRVRVWGRPGEWYNSLDTVLRHTARTAGVMVWGP
ncbi:hypothetical protein TNCV_1790821 [Trichonephila clavipes]|nr:hypothetical protein TNCV_1790821 [Trichonephila clavipes]